MVLAALDIVPADMAAQSFGLDRMETDAVALLIVVALAGAMILLDTGAARGKRGALVKGVVAGGFLLLAALRTTFLVVTSTASMPVPAVPASAALTAVSALLVVMGSVLLGHRVPKELGVTSPRRPPPRRRPPRRTGPGGGHRRGRTDLRRALGHRQHPGSGRRPAGIDPAGITAAVRGALTRLLTPYEG